MFYIKTRYVSNFHFILLKKNMVLSWLEVPPSYDGGTSSLDQLSQTSSYLFLFSPICPQRMDRVCAVMLAGAPRQATNLVFDKFYPWMSAREQ